MKFLFKKLLILLNTHLFRLTSSASITGKCEIFRTSIKKLSSENSLSIASSSLKRCFVQIAGTNNRIVISKCYLSRCQIEVIGNNNLVEISRGAGLEGVRLILKGESCKISIGEKTTWNGGRAVAAGLKNSVVIGSDCMISDGVEIWASDTHPILNMANQILNPDQPVSIEDNVWIGTGAAVLKGVTIGRSSVIGMNSVVTRTFSAGSIVAGNPARILASDIHWSRG